LFNDTVVVREDTLATKRSALVAWLKASRRGWTDNFRNPAFYPNAMRDTWLAPSGRTAAYDVFSNTAYQPLMTAPGGIFAMSEDSIARVIASLTQMGIPARRDMFDTTLLVDAA
jgi:hypothetical protein